MPAQDCPIVARIGIDAAIPRCGNDPECKDCKLDCFHIRKREEAIEVTRPEPLPKDPKSFGVGSASGVAAAVYEGGGVTRYPLDRARYGGLAGAGREIDIMATESGIRIEADGHYRVPEKDEGTSKFKNKDMTPDGEWKNMATGEVDGATEMAGEEVEVAEITPDELGVVEKLAHKRRSDQILPPRPGRNIGLTSGTDPEFDTSGLSAYDRSSIVGHQASAKYEGALLKGEEGRKIREAAEVLLNSDPLQNKDEIPPDDYKGVKSMSRGEMMDARTSGPKDKDDRLERMGFGTSDSRPVFHEPKTAATLTREKTAEIDEIIMDAEMPVMSVPRSYRSRSGGVIKAGTVPLKGQDEASLAPINDRLTAAYAPKEEVKKLEGPTGAVGISCPGAKGDPGPVGPPGLSREQMLALIPEAEAIVKAARAFVDYQKDKGIQGDFETLKRFVTLVQAVESYK